MTRNTDETKPNTTTSLNVPACRAQVPCKLRLIALVGLLQSKAAARHGGGPDSGGKVGVNNFMMRSHKR